MEFARLGVGEVNEDVSACLSNLVVGLRLLASQFENHECTKIR
jgi:hypothetical protein